MTTNMVEKGAYLRQCFDVVIIHDGIHPSIINTDQAGSVSFRVRNTAPVQYHLVLDKAKPSFSVCQQVEYGSVVNAPCFLSIG